MSPELKAAFDRIDGLRTQIDQAHREIAQVLLREEEARKACAEAQKPVAPTYRPVLRAMSSDALAIEAMSMSRWLAERARAAGPGAAHDSGEAKASAILDELVYRGVY